MSTSAVTPTCRYGHGPLLPHSPDAPADGYHLSSHRLFKDLLGTTVGSMKTAPTFTVKLFRCATCGYLEMFDDEGGGLG